MALCTASHSGVACKISIHGTKKATAKLKPGGTGSPACVMRVSEKPFPPTWESSGNLLALNG
jgi:hypothetical protein